MPNRQYSFYTDPQLWKEFKKKAIDEDTNTSKLVTELIKNYIKKN
jgi:hypothetical protein